MAKTPQINDIDRQAAEWAAATDGEILSAERQAAFDAWLAADIRHVGAYAKAVAVLAHVGRSSAIGLDIGRDCGSVAVGPSRRRMLFAGGLAASAAILAVAGDFAWTHFYRGVYSTSIGETKIVPLSDGSIVTLNTDSRIMVRYTKARRSIVLLRGEALFDVAKNKERPFIVTARDMLVRAVGTSFSVQLLAGRPVCVLVREGVVEVRRSDVPVAPSVLVPANALALASPDAPIATRTVTPDRVARDLAWRVGRVSFDDVTLAAAAREFSRYSNTRIVIDDPAVAKRTVTGLFVANDPVGFAKAVALSLDLSAEVGDNEVRLARKE